MMPLGSRPDPAVWDSPDFAERFRGRPPFDADFIDCFRSAQMMTLPPLLSQKLSPGQLKIGAYQNPAGF
jgi:hypothetical protein